jgi:rRNA pseudouridine-1189 N-methylase Emg1 (Nep1/Mra1 family)
MYETVRDRIIDIDNKKDFDTDLADIVNILGRVLSLWTGGQRGIYKALISTTLSSLFIMIGAS